MQPIQYNKLNIISSVELIEKLIYSKCKNCFLIIIFIFIISIDFIWSKPKYISIILSFKADPLIFFARNITRNITYFV